MLLAVGYLAGLFRERFEIHSALVPPLLCMALTLVAELGFGAVEVMFGIDAPVSVLVVRDMLIKSDLRLLPRLADLPAGCGASCARRWSTSRGCGGARQPTVLGA